MNPADLTPFVAAVAEQTHRLARALPRLDDVPQAAAVRHAVRKLRRELEAAGVTFVELTGAPYDPGFAVDVSEVRGDARARDFVVRETVFPILLWNGAVLRRGEVVIEGVRRTLGWSEGLRAKRRRGKRRRRG